MPNIVFKKYEQANTDGKTMVDIEIGIFFDGTRNNKYNSDAREAAKNSEDYKAFEKYGKKDKKAAITTIGQMSLECGNITAKIMLFMLKE